LIGRSGIVGWVDVAHGLATAGGVGVVGCADVAGGVVGSAGVAGGLAGGLAVGGAVSTGAAGVGSGGSCPKAVVAIAPASRIMHRKQNHLDI